MASATAQYTASMQIVVTGNCYSGASSTAINNARQFVNEFNAQFRSVPLTKEECLAMSQAFAGKALEFGFSEYGCSVKIIITPCICTGCQDEATPGPEQGGSYYSTNPGNEVRDWEADVERRNHALYNNASPLPSQVEEFFGKGSGDIRFDNALRSNEGMSQLPGNEVNLPSDFEFLANKENVQRYLDMTEDLAKRYIQYPDPDHLVGWFHDEFARVSGFNIDEIMIKLPSQRTDAENQALLDYQAYRRQLADKMIEEIFKYIAVQKETHAYENAVLSEDCYGDSKHNYLSNTNYQRIITADFAINDQMRNFSELIDKFNETNQYTGFHAVLYYNNVTGDYTVAFEGSNFHPIDNTRDFALDWAGNFDNEIFLPLGIHPQYIAAYLIAKAIPQGVTVNFTGHSLGGGSAIVAGAASGATTYVYNPEGIDETVALITGLRDNGNINVYQAKNDPLSIAQKFGFLNPAMGTKITIGDGGHSIIPMIGTLDDARSTFTSWQSSIHNAGYGNEQQTEDHILIIRSDE
jgi:hypothetical protein